MLRIVFVLLTILLISSCEKDAEQNSNTLIIKPKGIITGVEHFQKEIKKKAIDNKFDGFFVKLEMEKIWTRYEDYYYYMSNVVIDGYNANVLITRDKKTDLVIESLIVKNKNLSKALAANMGADYLTGKADYSAVFERSKSISARFYAVVKPVGMGKIVSKKSGAIQSHPAFAVMKVCNRNWLKCRDITNLN